MNERNRLPYWLGYGFILIPFLSLLFASICFILGMPINVWIFPVSLLVSIGSIGGMQKGKWTYVVVSCLLLFLLFFLSVATFDYSYDGQWYHQNSINSLVKGWNPLLEHHSSSILSSNELWVNHYTKGIETIAATFCKSIGYIECGKMVNFMIIASSLFFVYDFLTEEFSCFNKKKKLFFSFLISFSPVVVNQMFTYYIDWSLYSLYLIACTALLDRRVHPDRFILLGIILFLAATIKLNVIFHIGLLTIIIGIYRLYKKDYFLIKKMFISISIGVIGGLFIGAYNPYVTNVIDHGSPFYPLLGEESTDIMVGQLRTLEDKNRVESIFISLLSRPQHGINAENNFVITKSNIVSAGSPDARLGGFGLFFIEILFLSALLFVVCKEGVYPKKHYYWVLLYLFVSLLILPAGWWARYNPYFYLFPLCMLLYVEKTGLLNKWQSVLKNILYLFLILNICVSLGGVLCGEYLYKNRVKYFMDKFSDSPRPILLYSPQNAAIRYKLEERGIDYIDCGKDCVNYELPILGPDVFIDSTDLFIEPTKMTFLPFYQK